MEYVYFSSFLLFAIFLWLYGRRIFLNKKSKIVMHNQILKYMMYVHFISLFFVFFILFINIFLNINFKDIWVSRFIILTYTFTGICISYFAIKDNINKCSIIYIRIFSTYIFIFGLCAFIPYIGQVWALTVTKRFFNPIEAIYFEDKNLRIQFTFNNVFGGENLDIYYKKGVFKKKLYHLNNFNEVVISTKVEYIEDSIKIFLINENDGIQQIKLKK